jgi:3-hydroxyisobutyrate dehydrogenase-like beta-hydroxyacid dehydrogenase
MAKDIRLALEDAGSLALPQTRAVYEQYRAGLERGLGDEDFIGLMRLLE